MEIVNVKIADLVDYANNAKLHPHEQVDQIATSIEEFGDCDPIAVWTNADGNPEIVEGHGRVMALRKLGAETVPAIFLDHLTDEDRRAYALVHNKLTMNTGFDFEILSAEVEAIGDIDMEYFGFEDGADFVEEFNTSGEIDLDGFGDESFDHKCEACGFRFNDERA